MRSANKRVTVTFPPGAVKRQAKASVKTLDPSTYPSQGWNLLGLADLKARHADDNTDQHHPERHHHHLRL